MDLGTWNEQRYHLPYDGTHDCTSSYAWRGTEIKSRTFTKKKQYSQSRAKSTFPVSAFSSEASAQVVTFLFPLRNQSSLEVRSTSKLINSNYPN